MYRLGNGKRISSRLDAITAEKERKEERGRAEAWKFDNASRHWLKPAYIPDLYEEFLFFHRFSRDGIISKRSRNTI